MLSNEATLAMFVFAIVAIGAMSLSAGLMGARQASTNLRISGRHRPLRASQWAYQTWRTFADRFEHNIQGERPAIRQLQDILTNAGFDRNRGFVVFRTTQVVGTLFGSIAGIIVSNSIDCGELLGLVLGGSAGYMLPYAVLKRLKNRRQLELTRELPAVLDLLVVSLEAGLSIADGIKTVGQYVERQGRILGTELSISASEMVAGLRLEDSLRNLGERTGVDDIRSVSSLLIQSEKIGGSLGPALRASADQLVTKRRLRAEETAQKSAVKMLIPLVLFTLPAMIIVILGPAILQVLRTLTN
jgi:tight adherence protein C